MRRSTLIALLIPAAVILAVGGAVLAFGLEERLARHALALQREAQDALAAALRALRTGQPGAIAAFLGLCFAHGAVHALGPGHGKAVIAAYGLASDVAPGRILRLAAVSSLAQATVAVVLVHVALGLYGSARGQAEGLAAAIEPLSALALGLLGAMLFWRGARRLFAQAKDRDQAHDRAHDQAGQRHDDHSTHDHPADCGCDQSRLPQLEAALARGNRREAAALVTAIALRPCTSTLILLFLTWRFGLVGIGILGAYVMGLGTMAVTAGAALLAVAARSSLLPRAAGPLRAGGGIRGGALVFTLAELAIGTVIAIFALGLVLRA
ncbi:nickel/cobalt transporter [Pseudogemmobacter sonorensis]|uniref:nickel/cobalt transporter n=1 Tax=Pseudogemmobacter sonorensis TaxID=2989681 RepID=UPI003688B68E